MTNEEIEIKIISFFERLVLAFESIARSVSDIADSLTEEE